MKFFDMRSGFRIVGFTILAASLGGCASYFTRPSVTVGHTEFGTDAAAASPTAGSTVLQFAAFKFADQLRKSADDARDDTKARAAILAGRSLLNLRCSDYLDQIGLKNQRAANERRHVDIVGGFTSAIMGLTGSSAKAVAGVASSFSFAGSSLDSASATFLFSDASKSINHLVRDAQDKYVARLNEFEGDWTYADAVDILTGYEELCRPAKIRALVDEAISATTLVAETPANGSGKSLLGQVIGGLQAALGNKAISEKDAVILYDWYANTEERKAIEGTASFKDVVKRLALKPDKIEEKVAPIFIAAIRNKSSPLLASWAKQLEALKQERAKPNGTPAANVVPVPTEAGKKLCRLRFASSASSVLDGPFAA